MSDSLAIGEVSRTTGVSIETIRFYERQGLIDAPKRKESGYRQFSEQHVRRLLFIQQAKTLGFSLKEIGELLSIREDPKSGTREVKALAKSKLDDIEAKMKMLKRMRKSLKSLVDSCPGDGPKRDCPILEALDTKG